MARIEEEVLVCTICHLDLMDVHTYKPGDTLIETEIAAHISNVAYPFKYYKAIQQMSKTEFETLTRNP